jgi:ABC-type Na+ efflux pump permease subunit
MAKPGGARIGRVLLFTALLGFGLTLLQLYSKVAESPAEQSPEWLMLKLLALALWLPGSFMLAALAPLLLMRGFYSARDGEDVQATASNAWLAKCSFVFVSAIALTEDGTRTPVFLAALAFSACSLAIDAVAFGRRYPEDGWGWAVMSASLAVSFWFALIILVFGMTPPYVC